MSQLILIVEDDTRISEIIAYNLNKEGFETICATDGELGLKLAVERKPCLILLDIMLPGVNGFEVCSRIRKTSSVPIIMLTARESEEDRVTGLEIGADDYVIKPFSMREIISRVRANLRRTSTYFQNGPAESGGITFDAERQEARLEGRRIELSALELDLLRFMAAAPEKVYSREELLENIWGYQYFGGTRVVDVAVRRLREKLEECSAGGKKYIATKHGAGYYFSPNNGDD